MLRYVVCTVLVACALAAPSLLDLDREWTLFKQTHNKQYSEEADAVRRIIWESNLKLIEQHNLEADRGLHTYRLGMNHLGDLTREEVVEMLNGYRMDLNRTAGSTYLPPSNVGPKPKEVDWRKEGYVTPVKNQLHCGSCWAFSSTGSLEGQHFKKTGKLVSLSEQNLVDCSQKEGNKGCHGGLMDNAFRYIEINDGIDTEMSYPYTAKDGITCRFRQSEVGATDRGYTDIMRYDERALESAVATVGPISVAIDASRPTFHLYRSGVYYDPQCSSKKLDHGVLAVGYGTLEGEEYWLVKNSWGAEWGKNGYIYMARNRDNACGIATQASYPKV